MVIGDDLVDTDILLLRLVFKTFAFCVLQVHQIVKRSSGEVPVEVLAIQQILGAIP